MNTTTPSCTALLALSNGSLVAHRGPGHSILVESDQAGRARCAWTDRETCGEWDEFSPYGQITSLAKHPDGKTIIAGTSLGYIGLVSFQSGMASAFRTRLSFSFRYTGSHRLSPPASRFKPSSSGESRAVATLKVRSEPGRTWVEAVGNHHQTVTIGLASLAGGEPSQSEATTGRLSSFADRLRAWTSPPVLATVR